ncbi:MAG TPA: MoxR family ATPase [Leptospiraceae bacterium]|nr:MoxR family ATPase [Leptospiraceae bacterium]HMW04945.1 MoxR family ATPase [Leptospiraceae bacterium]HMX31906.1 MoxR family ATPase [Leptospiraceae bacterium]HMY30834.1 MoxR family ATPase [Leptospiraceae bacterium]HMZ64295.1 MoxR family ATPase [Leptospiraceae bacterium]
MSKNAEAVAQIKKIKEEIHKGIVGQESLVDGLILGILADGHILIEGVPGLAKTRAVNLFANICNVQFKRLQFTPDLLPADIVGTRIYNQSKASFEVNKGPIFTNFVLADEINRAPAKVQSALLETMQEKQVTIGEETFPVPRPFFVFATMNPVEQEGTYSLPEAQLDRFLMKLIVNYPTKKEEADVVKMVIQETKLPSVEKLLNPDDILNLQKICRGIFIEDKIISYITDLIQATRDPKAYGLNLENVIQYGASPRASIALALVGRARALMFGRDSVMPEDIKAIAHNVLRHRILPTYYAEAEGIKTEQIINEILSKVKVP